jgi:hypothetical protein
MDRIREWSFPVALLTLWVVAAGYTLTSLGHALAAAQKPVVRVQATQDITVVASKRVSLAREAKKPATRRGPRA